VCSKTPGNFWPSNPSLLKATTRELCGLHMASAPELLQEYWEVLQACQRRSWRNEVAMPILAAHEIPVIPMEAALSTRSLWHVGEGRKAEGKNDCTHWCQGSDATRYMAAAALNVVRAVILDTESPP
jgi:hypothetical protein